MTLELVLRRETLKVPVWKRARAPLSVRDFRQFVLELEEKDVEVTNANIGGLFPLSDVFGFWSVWAAFKGVVMQEAEARQSRIASFTFQRSAASPSLFTFRATIGM
jgi:hypothetical protein